MFNYARAFNAGQHRRFGRVVLYTASGTRAVHASVLQSLRVQLHHRRLKRRAVRWNMEGVHVLRSHRVQLGLRLVRWHLRRPRLYVQRLRVLRPRAASHGAGRLSATRVASTALDQQSHL